MNKSFIIAFSVSIVFLFICLFIYVIDDVLINSDDGSIPNNSEILSFPSGVSDDISYNVVYEQTNYVQLVINDSDVVLIELYEDDAPITVANFKSLVEIGYYDGLTFHRIIEEFMVQGGIGDDVDSIVGEFSSNGYDNDIKHVTGTISMARNSDYNSASSQFFICLNDTGCNHLDSSYAAFGNVIAGMDNILKLGLVDTDSSDEPIDEQIITSIRFIEMDN